MHLSTPGIQCFIHSSRQIDDYNNKVNCQKAAQTRKNAQASIAVGRWTERPRARHRLPAAAGHVAQPAAGMGPWGQTREPDRRRTATGAARSPRIRQHQGAGPPQGARVQGAPVPALPSVLQAAEAPEQPHEEIAP